MTQQEQRAYWVEMMDKIARPVLHALSQGRLRTVMPVEQQDYDRRPFAHLEAFGRTLCGIAPWIELKGLTEEEEKLRAEYQQMALRCLDFATNPQSPDYMNYDMGAQPVVDAAFLAHGLVRAPESLIGAMDAGLKRQVAAALRKSRKISPGPSNWLLFSGMVETALFLLGEEDYDMLRIKYALRSFYTQWYKGDGVYGDGAPLHVDYYNSFVIAPMLVDITRVFSDTDEEIASMRPDTEKRASRYAFILERLISPEGTYPIIGRSICYRFGAFQMLSQAALEHILFPGLAPAQVRCALTAVIQRIMESSGVFDAQGWLRPGVYGYQPGLGEGYICTGSLYLCCAVFLALGLPPEDPFWKDENVRWTSQRVAAGEDLQCDHSIPN
ncbi:MAG: DUF2264 domain-containing protein [Provencibacterium sp.]|nr:DUF2264 domain-containing protein [Provencibacterium sp.]